MTVTIAEAAILGAVQGVTEFFPISSSGHLVIMQGVFGIKEPQVAFDVFLHLGTLVSVLVFFRAEILALFVSRTRKLFMLAAASVPTFIIGFLSKGPVERYFGMPRLVGFMLLVTGAWLFAAVIFQRRRAVSGKAATQAEPGLWGALAIGVAQGVAVIPGISRSGATIATGIMAGLEKRAACAFSFLLSVPAVAGASMLKARGITAGLAASDAAQFAAGGITAMITGVLAIKFLLKLVGVGRLYLFGIYCFLAGLAVIMFYR